MSVKVRVKVIVKVRVRVTLRVSGSDSSSASLHVDLSLRVSDMVRMCLTLEICDIIPESIVAGVKERVTVSVGIETMVMCLQ